MRFELKPLLTGFLSHTPLKKMMFNTTGTISARYCYSVWLRHLCVAFEHGVNKIPGVIAELGPGDSLGIGMAALLSGAHTYLGLDLIPYVTLQKNLDVLTELVELFKNHTSIPDESEFPQLKPYLKDYRFPFHIFNQKHIEMCLSQPRLEKIKAAIYSQNNNADMTIQYHAPWFHTQIVRESSVDMIFSQAVLEHVENLDQTYHFLNLWLKTGGYMSHQIDFRSHGTSRTWNGHLTYNDKIWRLMRGNRPYFINRKSYSDHVKMHEKHGFCILSNKPVFDRSGFSRQELDPRFQYLTDTDLTVSGTHFLSQKQLSDQDRL